MDHEALGVTHCAFADETHWNKGRYRALAMITLDSMNVSYVENSLLQLLKESDMREFKWSRMRQARDRFAAYELCNFSVNAACRRILRINVLAWDTEDSRHRIEGRDDIANLQRMYYHLFRNVLRKRWPDGSIWLLHPDEQTALDWTNIQDFLELTNSTLEICHNLFTAGTFKLRLRQEFQIVGIHPVSSGDHPLIQLADLFAGICVFSKESYFLYKSWLKKDVPSLFVDSSESEEMNALTRERCSVFCKLDGLCKRRKLGVSLDTYRSLRTLNPKNPINFWWYEPQHPLDKAPTR